MAQLEPVAIPQESSAVYDAVSGMEYVAAQHEYRESMGTYLSMLKDHKEVPCSRGPQWCSCPARSELFRMVLEYYTRNGMQVKLFDPSTETEAEREARNSYVTKPGEVHTQFLLHKCVDGVDYVELNIGTVARTFEMFSIRPSESEWKEQKLSITLTERGIEASREPANREEWLTCAAARFVDWQVVRRHSLRLRRGYLAHAASAASRTPPEEPVWPERYLFEACRDSDTELRAVEDCEAIFLGGVSVERNSTGVERRHRGFAGGLCALGVSGYGVGFLLGRRKAADPRPTLYTIDLAQNRRPVVKYLRVAKKGDGGDKDKAALETEEGGDVTSFRLDISSVDPCWRRCENIRGKAPASVYMHAVSGQRSLGEAHDAPLPSIAAVLGTASTATDLSAALDRLELYLYVQPTYVDEALAPCEAGVLVMRELPFAPALPTFIVVSTRFVVAVMASTRDGSGRLMPPHMWVHAIGYDAAGTALRPLGRWTPFLVNMPVHDANNPVPRKLLNAVESGQTPPLISGAFDSHDPRELLLGTYDGALMAFRLGDVDPATDEPSCVVRDVAPYLSPDYLSELAAANSLIETLTAAGKPPSDEDKAAVLEHVGKFRCAVTSIFASFTTHGGADGPECWWGRPVGEGADPRLRDARTASRVLCGFAGGIAWQFGDASTTAEVCARHLQPAAQKEGGMPVSVATFGGIVALHEGTENSIVLFDAKDGNLLGSFKDPAKHSVMTGPKIVYQSLWMDVGRIACVMPDGDVVVIAHLSPESLAQRDEQLAKRQAAIKRLYEDQLKELEEKTSAMTITTAGGGEREARAPVADAAMADVKLG